MNPIALIEQSHELERALMESGGELTPHIEAAIMILSNSVDAVSLISERLTMSARYWHEKAAKADILAKSLQNVEKRLKESLKQGMVTSGTKELKGSDIRFVLASCQKKLVIDESGLPDIYKKQVTSYMPDKVLIRDGLESGAQIPGASLEGGWQLREYSNRQAKMPAVFE